MFVRAFFVDLNLEVDNSDPVVANLDVLDETVATIGREDAQAAGQAFAAVLLDGAVIVIVRRRGWLDTATTGSRGSDGSSDEEDGSNDGALHFDSCLLFW